MNHRRAVWISTLLATTLAGLAGCATGSRLESAPMRVDELMTWIEKVHLEADLARATTIDAQQQLQALAAGAYSNTEITQAYARFVQTIDVADRQARRFGEVVGPMQTAAKPVFEQWATDVATIGNQRLRTRSELRLAVTKERYDALMQSATESQRQLDTYVASLRDHATFLAHDLNASALADIQQDVKMVAAAAKKLDQELDRCLGAARAYVDNSALPAQGTPASPGSNR